MSVSQWVFIRPIDRVYFGAPLSLVAGDVHGGRSEFPPAPSTVAGMIRTHLLEGAAPRLDLNDWSAGERARRAKLVGTASELPPGWQLLGPFPAMESDEPPRRPEPWLSVPVWVTCTEAWNLVPHRFVARRGALSIGTEDGEATTPIADDDAKFDENGIWIAPPRTKSVEHAPKWIPASTLAKLLATGAAQSIASAPWLRPWKEWYHDRGAERIAGPPFVRWETAAGVAIDRGSGTAIDNMLYSLEMLRFAPRSGILTSITGSLAAPLSFRALETGVGRAGRKGQLAAFEPVRDGVSASWHSLLDTGHLHAPADSDTFWIYLATPARMSDPYDDAIAELRRSAPRGVSVSLLSLATGEPQVIGGLAIEGLRPRANRLYARAGSGWLVRVRGGEPVDRSALLQRFHGRCSLGPESERAFGFGFTLVGRGPRVPLDDASVALGPAA